ncbi:DUF305 domain-containing protein [Roseisolibacter agri]|uniref:DUF305 domain-containing protein n=1 Tax=Roseisolibacter agri TaxID=2014610 RepID=A0AA37VG94_9BACT|nr:DUF305 domain-containing protein [Roseisolibacter agri]GLC28154.1 hypothetical protein rosag_46670 [Roseisolibacter agri]
MRQDHAHATASRLNLGASLLFATFAMAACSGSKDAGTDSAAGVAGDTAGVATAPAPAAQDTGMAGMAGMDHSQMTMHRPAPRDSNQAFLRMMGDHHEGLVAMSDSAQPRLTGATAKSDAQKLRQKQESEQQRMLAMLSGQYSDSVTPMIMPSNRAMIDSVTRAPQGAEADRAYYRQVIAHHREAIQMTEPLLPHLTGEVKQMAERMVADQRREIQEFERKASAGGQG